ncbi:MAG: 3-hydroxyacyl-CoA dehydrogenase NAD-binding domain-containing protein, partial [Pseudomonadota bacterium]
MTVVVIGGGLMGHGIALTFARAGFDVRVVEPVEAARASLSGRVRESLALLGAGAEEIAESLGRITSVA